MGSADSIHLNVARQGGTKMNARHNTPRLFRAAVVAIVGLAMTCGLLILMGGLALPVGAAPMAGPVNSDITTDTTWTLAGSPYIVSTDTVAVRNGAKLTINPGVEVRFQAGAQLQVRDNGQLQAIGTPSQPITFTSNLLTPSRGAWSGIRFDQTALTGTIQYAVIEYPLVGVELNRVGQYYNVSSNTFRYIGDYDGDISDGGAIIGVPDDSDLSYNTVYSSEVGIRLNKAFNNVLRGNNIYNVDSHCIALLSAGPGSPGGGGNQFISNQLHDCRANGIRLEGSGVSGNQVMSNVVWSTYNEGVYVANQSTLQFQANTIYSTAFTTATGTGGSGTNLGAVAFVSVDGINARDNYLYNNGAGGSPTYAGAFYVRDAGSLGALVIANSRILDNNRSGLVFDGTNTSSSQTINNNAICVATRYEIENRDGALTAEGNWLGTNFPTTANEISGTVDYTPSIQLALTPTNSSILANGTSTTTLNITFNDGAGHVVPASARGITVTASAGTLSTGAVTVNGSGLASLVLTSTPTPGTAVITATDSCGYAVTTTVTFAGYVDLVVSKTASPPPYSPSPPDNLITYTISYRNAGNTMANGVVLTETLPTSTTFAGRPAGWVRVGTSNQYTRAVGSVAPASGTLATTFVVTIDSGLPTGDFSFVNTVQIGDNGASGADYNPLDNTFVLTLTGGSLPDLWVVKNDNEGAGALSGPLVGALAKTPDGPAILEMVHALGDIGAQQVPEGGLITYTIGYGNSSRGVGPASGVVLSETLPLHTTFVGPTGPNGWTAVGGGVYTYYIGSLGHGLGDYVYFTVRVDSSLPPTVTEVVNTVCIRGAQNDLIPSNDCSSEQTPIITGTYDLSVIKVANATCLNPGDALNYQITVSNMGASSASNVVLRETLPANTTFIGLPGSGWTDAGGGVYTYSLGTVPSGATSLAVFGVQINPGLGPSVTAITNTASVQADGSDSNPANNSFTLVTPIGTTPDLVISKNDNTSDQVRPGNDVITYTIGYLNNSNRYTATNVVITDTLPPGTIITGSSSPWHRVGSSNDYTVSVGTLGPNEFGSLELTVQVTQTNPYPYGSEVVNQVQIRGAEAECDLSDNFATEETPVQGANAADLAVTKADNVPFCAVPGDVIAYTIAYTNNSYSVAADNVVLTETIDTAAVTFLGPAGATGWSGGGATYTHAVTSPLATRASGTTVFDVQVAPSIGQDYITNVVRIGTTSPDWDITNNVFTLSTYVPPWPDLIVIKNDNIGSLGMSAQGEMDDLLARLHFSPEAEALLRESLRRGEVGAMAEFINPGGIITYTVILGNIGRENASNVVLTETLPAGTTFMGPGYWHHVGSTIPNNTYTYTVGALDAGTGDVLQFIVRVDNPFLAGSRVLNTVQIGGSEPECNTANNTSNEETPVQGAGFAEHMHLPIILKGFPAIPPTPTPRPPTPTPTAIPPAPLAYVSDVAADPVSGRVYVASPRHDWVYTIINDALSALTVGVSHGPTGLDVLTRTAQNSKVFVVHVYDWERGARVFDTTGGGSRLVAPQGGYVGAGPYRVAVNSLLNRAYVSNYYDKLAVLNADGEARLGWVVQKGWQGAYGIDANQATGRVYLATRDTGELVVLDGNGDRLLQSTYIPTHFKPPQACSLYSVAVNENTGHIFVPCPALKQVIVWTESDMSILSKMAAQGEIGTLEVREGGLARVIRAQDTNPHTVSITYTNVTASVGQEGIAVDPGTNRVFIGDPNGNLLVTLQDTAAITGISVLAPVSVGTNPQGVDVLPGSPGKVYVGNAGSNTVTVLWALTPTQVITTIPLTP
jgi:uncharacterized repeat protein (TIGR01451 family)